MAGPAPDFQLPNASFFNIYADAPLTTTSPNLPGGPCNYVDLTPGASGHKCGCRRFWSRASLSGTERGSPIGFPPGFANAYDDQTVWCMCSHHACFHDDARDSQTPVPTPAVASIYANGQENERPRANREPLTPVVTDLSFSTPKPVSQHLDLNTVSNPDLASHGHENARLGETPQPSMPDTLAWASLIHSEPTQASPLHPIPSQCLMASQPSSTTSSTRIAYLKPFAGKGLQTLSGVRPTILESLQEKEKSQTTEPENEDTIEPDTDQSVDDAQTVTNTPRSARHRDMIDGPDQSPTPRITRDTYHILSNNVKGHEQRIENLENISFSAAAHDACHEKHDQADLRLTELESRVEEVEKALNDNASSVSGHGWSRRERIDDTAASVVSVSTSTGSYAMDRAELQNELRILKAQLSQLQGISSFSTFTQPWEVEVVFLPFPLKNIWLESRDFGSQRLSNGNLAEVDLWIQLPHNPEPQSPDFNDWAGPEVDSDWLLGRACAPDNMIGQRLKSRGLVKNVTVRGPDARSVQQAMSEAFGTLFRTFSRMQANVHHGSTVHHRVAKFLGLQSPWIPLRKLHKDSRLRFLTPAEMVTPVSWDVQFLASSVVMKSHGTHRLFITHPEAYLQNQDAYENGWTWQRLRELSRVYGDSQNSQEILEGNAKEECWTWNNILDEPPNLVGHILSVQLAQASAQEHWRAMSTLASSRDVFATARGTSPSIATRRSISRAQSPVVLRERRASKTPGIRTASVPTPLQTVVSPAIAKRRVTAQVHPNERYVSPLAAQILALSKRRSSRSPALHPYWFRHTPSRSKSSSSSPAPEIVGRRATSPCYATPSSNAPFVKRRPSRGNVNILEEDDIDFDFDIAEGDSNADIYEDDVDENDENEADGDDSSMADLGEDSYHTQPHESWQDGQALEDEPWPGFDDIENHNPDVNIHVDDDAMMDGDARDVLVAADADGHETQSQGSSAPSEYPSNRPPWVTSGREQEFRVFEDR
ncbi:hypothetical protein GQX73_g10218 [Xylaria multiplex]|uniref:Uncharacterized protein n=1 Tax=Xylaria multiplex TaxID=323545 RepID=A0A7C8MQY4_9PEZI|nr:hypothetical protein GQX73_g10218 [Xylaria multiplex]